MFVHYLREHDHKRAYPLDGSGEIITHNPTLIQIEESLRAMDGRWFRELYMAQFPPTREIPFVPMMKVERWHETHWYTCYAQASNEGTLFNLTNPKNSELPFQLTHVYGQPDWYPAIACNPLDDVITVAKTFAENGKFDDRYQWIPSIDIHSMGEDQPEK